MCSTPLIYLIVFFSIAVGIACVCIEETEGGKRLMEKYKCVSSVVSREIQDQVNAKNLESFKTYKPLWCGKRIFIGWLTVVWLCAWYSESLCLNKDCSLGEMLIFLWMQFSARVQTLWKSSPSKKFEWSLANKVLHICICMKNKYGSILVKCILTNKFQKKSSLFYSTLV